MRKSRTCRTKDVIDLCALELRTSAGEPLRLSPTNWRGIVTLRMIREVLRFRNLLYMMVWRDIRIKYKQSVLGVMWAILMPATIVLAGVVVKFAMAKVTGKPLAAHDLANVSVRAVPWAFFIASIRFGTNCLVGNANLVTKVYFPKVIFPLSAILSQFVDFLIACGVLAIILILLGIPLSWSLLWLPVLVAMLVVLAAGLAIFLSAAGLFFRDVKYLVEMFLTFAIFFTPVFFDAAMFGEWKNLLLLNPVAPILEGISAAVTGQGGLPLGWLIYSASMSLAIFAGSLLFFEKTGAAVRRDASERARRVCAKSTSREEFAMNTSIFFDAPMSDEDRRTRPLRGRHLRALGNAEQPRAHRARTRHA